MSMSNTQVVGHPRRPGRQKKVEVLEPGRAADEPPETGLGRPG